MTPPPFFIIGFQRSGTTLLRLMLDHHPELAIPLDTTGLWSRYEARLSQYDHLATVEATRRLIDDLLGEERIQLWEAGFTAEQVLARRQRPGFPGIIEAFHLAYATAHGKARWGDKDPGNMLRMDTVNRWFPDARFLHIIRDGRDACLSQLQQSFGYDDCLPCAEAWREQVQWVCHTGRILGTERYWEVRYEDLVADPMPHLMAACRLIGVPYAPSMLEYHRDVERSIPASKRHLWPLINEPPRMDNTGLWRRKMSRGTRAAFERRAGSMLRTMGYDTLPPPARGGYGAEARSLLRRAWLSLRRKLLRPQ